MFKIDKRIFYVILAICVILTIAEYSTNPVKLLGLLISIPGVLIAISFHECAHAWTAYKLGDDTAKSQGRISLNPFKHIDPLGIVLLLFAGFGWGKPVEIDSRNFRKDISARKATAIVSIAGPLANFILAIVFALIYGLLLKLDVFGSLGNRATFTIVSILQSIIVMNLGLGVFNLIPLPPLDGSKVLSYFLPYKAQQWFENNENVFYIIFLVLWITGIAGFIISPAIAGIYSGLMKLVYMIFNI